MKKRKDQTVKPADDGELFPVDTLGIPILIDVVQTDTSPGDTDDPPEVAVNTPVTEKPPPHSRSKPDRESSRELPAELDLDWITDRIVKSVTAEMTTLLEPVVRSKVNLALQNYQDELLRLVKRENRKRP